MGSAGARICTGASLARASERTRVNGMTQTWTAVCTERATCPCMHAQSPVRLSRSGCSSLGRIVYTIDAIAIVSHGSIRLRATRMLAICRCIDDLAVAWPRLCVNTGSWLCPHREINCEIGSLLARMNEDSQSSQRQFVRGPGLARVSMPDLRPVRNAY